MAGGGVLMTGREARAYLGLGMYRWRKLVEAGVIPRWDNPLGGWPMYSKLALDAWAVELGRTA